MKYRVVYSAVQEARFATVKADRFRTGDYNDLFFYRKDNEEPVAVFSHWSSVMEVEE